MGDRGNICMIDSLETPKCVYFYAHWKGFKLPHVVRSALMREVRWNDGPYLARIIFCELMSKDADSETGYGISNHLCDNSYPITVVNPAAQTVGFANPPQCGELPVVHVEWSFEDYIGLTNDELNAEYKFKKAEVHNG